MGADKERAVSPIGLTPLHCAAHKGHLEAAQILVEAGADIERAVICGTTPLHLAAGSGHTAVVLLLLGAGARTQCQKRKNGETPLYLAAVMGHLGVVQTLLKAGATDGRLKVNSCCHLVGVDIF